MRRLKIISLWTAGILGSMPAIYLVILLLLPQFIDFEAVKKEIRTQFSQTVGGRINLLGFRPQILSAYLFQKSGWQITQGRSDVSLHFPIFQPMLTGAKNPI